MKTLAIVLAGVALLLTGCSPSNSLSREEAAQLIRNASSYPIEHTMDFILDGNVGAQSPYIPEAMNTLNKFGVAKARSTRVTTGGRTVTVFKIELTAKGKQHQRGSVFRSKHGEPLATLVVQTCEFGEVTGITYVNEARTSALVEYTQPCSFTPFAHAYDPYITEGLVWSSAKKYREALQKNAGTQKVRFQLYDDGWRIAS